MSYASEQAVLNCQWNAAQEATITEQARRAPHVLMRPRLFLDGNQYCALYGEDLMDGCAGFGDTPEAAMADFDKNWRTMRAPKVRATPPQPAASSGYGEFTPITVTDKTQPAASVPCPRCGGKGVYDSYAEDGHAFEFECYDCHGTGQVPAKTEGGE